MTRLLDNLEWCRQLGYNAWQAALERFTTEGYAQQVAEVLSTIPDAPELPKL